MFSATPRPHITSTDLLTPGACYLTVSAVQPQQTTPSPAFSAMHPMGHPAGHAG
jgi:hypothetical protein